MPSIRAQVVLHTVDNVAENFITNTFAFTGTDPFGDRAAITAALDAFYTSVGTNILGQGIAAGGHEIKYYDLPGPIPNYPLATDVFALAGATTIDPLPAEVALCLSFQGPKTPGFPQARRRGRIYIGPIKSTLTAAGRPTAACVTNLVNFGNTLLTTISALPSDTRWSVWSVADQEGVVVTNGWVDDAWDTQRRRGIDRTSRTLFP